ncbi:MAG: hypothetical protein EHM20_02165 [Alphaproteobacteria bacterium]|nr:MAG: hypothetical protein EHM20_02165 [Alphaproteobacteria bacterium]
MNMNKRSKFIVLFLVILFFGIVLVPGASCTTEKSATAKEENVPKSVEDSQWSEWKQAHTVEVETTTVYDYKKDGTLKITETYSGEKLKGKFMVDKLTRSQTFPVSKGKEIAITAKKESLKLKPGEKKELVTQESIVLTPSDEPYNWWTSTSSTSLAYPQWTFSKLTSFRKTYYEVADPINLIWEQKSLMAVKNVILNQKWVDNPVEYTHYIPYPDGSWVTGDGVAENKYRIAGGYHLRLWELPGGNTVSNAHHDDNVFIIPGHQIDGFENAETKVAGFFGTTHGVCSLDNVYYSDYYNAYNNGLATLV